MSRFSHRKAPYSLNGLKVLSSEQAAILEGMCKRHLEIETYRRDALLILLGLRTGARASELLLLRRQFFSPNDEMIFVQGIKGSEDRELPLPKWLARATEIHLRKSENEYLFPITYSRLHQIWEQYRPVNKKFHALRHTFALKIYLETRDVRLVQRALGHRNINNTLIYVDYAHTNQEMRRLIFQKY